MYATRSLLPFLSLALILSFAAASRGAETSLFVSPDGSDAWSGKLAAPNAQETDGPLRSLAAARDAVRRGKADGSLDGKAVVVEIAPGEYELTQSLEFTAADSGTDAAPITYRATGDGVHLMGGRVVEGFEKVRDAKVLDRLRESARAHVVTLHLPSAGVTDFGRIVPSGFGRRPALSHLELFVGGEAMRLAEWPNQRWLEIASVPQGEKIVDGSGKTRGVQVDRFEYPGDRPAAWKSLDDVWVHGYWFVDWADQYIPVEAIDADANMVILGSPQSGYGYKKGQRFRFLNVLEELDSPGEYYLDRASGMLYAWLPEDSQGAMCVVSLLKEPMVRMRGASHLRLEGLELGYARGDGIVIDRGEGVLVAGCSVANLGGSAVRISGGTGHRVQSCDLKNLGGGGIYVSGGDRKTLTPAGHAVVNNHIHYYSRWVRTYQLGIRLSGVGLRASHNLLHDAPHCGISYGGNDHVIEWNELHTLCQDTGDVGGIYTGRDWTARGTVLRYNHLHHFGGLNMGSNAIYLDDLASGQTIRGNLIHDVWRAMMIGGGRDNVVEDNVFYNYKIGIHLDARGIGWSRKLIEGRQGSWDMYGRLEAVPYRKAPYATKYPRLPNLLNEEPLEPWNNRVADNLFVGQPWLDPRRMTQEEAEEKGWLKRSGNRFAETLNIDVDKLPAAQAGLEEDVYRHMLPTR